MNIEAIDFQKMGGLVPAVVQDSTTFRVLMVGFMNREAVEQTLNDGFVTFFSRTKNRLWKKGESSGNLLTLTSIHLDCDQDALLLFAQPTGSVCHSGEDTCFHDDLPEDIRFFGELHRLIEGRLIEKRRAEKQDDLSSYTAKLFASGLKRMAQKVGEEGVEVSLAAVSGDEQELLNESADLLYHLQLLLIAKGVSLRDVGKVLHDRHLASRRSSAPDSSMADRIP